MRKLLGYGVTKIQKAYALQQAIWFHLPILAARPATLSLRMVREEKLTDLQNLNGEAMQY